jgi:hypothetical protein
LGETGTRGQQGIQLPGALQHVEASERGDDVLLHAACHPLALDDLEIFVLARFLLADEPGRVSFPLPD